MQTAFRTYPDNEMARQRQEAAARNSGNSVLATSGAATRFGDGQFPFVQNTAPIVTPEIEQAQDTASLKHKTFADWIDERMNGPGGNLSTAEDLPLDAP
jgi:hypothetical protein